MVYQSFVPGGEKTWAAVHGADPDNPYVSCQNLYKFGHDLYLVGTVEPGYKGLVPYNQVPL